MSNVIEQKILEMRFDNKQFENNVGESISTLEKLKSALNFDKMADCFSGVTAAAGRVDFSPISSGVETVIVKFNALEMAAVQAISNIITNGLDRLQSVVNDLTFDQISAGWDKYNEKTESVQTIMNATGKSIEEVNEQLMRLNWFSDETSFSFTDMTSNVGKFTAVNVELEDAVTAMEGISTWAALSGQSASEASRAYYNLAQAMAVGSVKLMDWRSIENAQMATTEFKKTALETAAALGTLREFADGTYQTIDKGTNVTVKDFNSALSEGWFTTEVLMKTLEKYGGYANELSKICEETGVAAHDMDQAFIDWMEDSKSFDEIAEDVGMSADELRPYLEKLSDTEWELGRKAFLAAQQAKTFNEAMEATRDAVSTGWMKTFEYLFGNYEQAADFFTNVTDYLWDLFAASGEVRNEILKQWSEMGDEGKHGGDMFRAGLLNILESTTNIVEYIRKIVYQITGIWDKNGDLSEKFVKKVYKYTEAFAGWTDELVKFTANIHISEKAYEGIKQLFKGFGSAIGIFTDAVCALKPVFSWLLDILGTVGSYLVENVFRTIGMCTTALRVFIDHNDLFEKAVSKVTEFAVGAWTRIKDVLSPITDLLDPIIDKIAHFFDSGRTYHYYYQLLYKIKDKLEEIFKVSLNFDKADAILGKIKEGLTWIVDHLKKAFDSISKFFAENDIASVLSDIWKFLKNIAGTLWDVASFVGSKFISIGSDIVGTFRNMFSGIRQAFKDYKIEDVFSALGGGLSDTLKNLGSADISGFLGNLGKGVLALGGFNLAKLFGSASKGIDTLTGSVSEGGIGGILKSFISPITDIFDGLKEGIGSFTEKVDPDRLRSIAIAIGILTLSLVVLSGIDSDKMTTALEGLAGVLVGLFAEMKGLSKIDLTGGKQMKNVGLAMIEMAAAAFIMVEAIKPFGEMNTEKLLKSLGAMTVIMVEFGVFIAAFAAISRANQVGNTKDKGILGIFQKSNGFDKQLKNAAMAMIELGAAMKIFASAAKDFNDVNGLKRSIGAMTIVMTEMAAFIFVVSKLDTKGIGGVAFAMIELGGAMKIFASALQDISSIEYENLKNGIAGMTAAWLEMSAFVIVASAVGDKSGQILVISGAMVVLGFAMQTFAEALTVISGIEHEPLKDAIIAMIAVMSETVMFIGVARAVADKSGQILVIAASMVILGEAFKIFASVMNEFAQNEPHEWLNALAQMTACWLEMLIFIGIAKSVASSSTQILVISAAMVVLGLGMQTFAAAAKDFADVRWEELGKAGAVLAGLLVAIAALGAIGTVSKVGLDTIATTFLAIGGAIALIGIGIAALNLASFTAKLSEVGRRLVYISDSALALVRSMEISSFIDLFVKVLLALPEVISGVITGLVTGIINGLGTILGSLGKLFEGAEKAILAFLKFVEAVFPEIIDTMLTLLLDTLSTMLEKAPEILDTFAKLVLKLIDGLIEYLPEIVKKLSQLIIKLFDNLKQYIPEIVVSFMNFISAFFESVLDVIKNTDKDTLLKIAEMFTGLIVVIEVLNLVKSAVPGAMAGLAEVALFVAELGLIIAAFGALNAIPGFQWLVEKGGDLLEEIGKAIGKFVGGIIGGFAEGATSTLPEIGKNIAGFWTNVKPFIDGVSGIDMDTAAKVGILSASILVLTAADFIGGIADFLRDATNVGEFGTSISKMWKNIQPFINGVKNLDPKITKSVESLSKALLMMTAANLIDGISKFVLGETDIDKFGVSIAKLGPYMKKFSDSVKDINTRSVKTASESISILADTFSHEAFKTGGVVQWFSGESSLIKFGQGLVTLGPMIMTYAKSVEGLPVDVIENSVKGASALTEMAKTVPPTGGLLQAMTGKRDLVEFAIGLSLLGPNLMMYAKSVKGLDTKVVDNSITAAKAISEFAANIEDKSLVDRIFSKDKMTEFSDSLVKLGNSLLDYYNKIRAVNPSHISNVLKAYTDMMDIFSGSNGKSFKIDTSITKVMKEAAEKGVATFVNTINSQMDNLLKVGTDIADELLSGISGREDDFIVLINKILSDMLSRISTYYSVFKRYGANLMTYFNQGLSSVTSTISATAESILSKLREQFSSQSLLTWFRQAGRNLMIQFSAGILESADAVALSASSLANTALNELKKKDLLTSFASAGSNVGGSFVKGLNAQSENVIIAANNLSESAKNAVNDTLNELEKRIDQVMNSIDYDPVITPVIDTSDAEAALDYLQNQYDYFENNFDRLRNELDGLYPDKDKTTGNKTNAWDNYTGNTVTVNQNFYGNVNDTNAVADATSASVNRTLQAGLFGYSIPAYNG